ncbi:F-box and leucine-rich protein 22 [Platysternon megacephalum]|uniref:F-box and leucine-rich protein 22 n=1 Tax=Platysternon megacephalum TaxID=55544 RepID=A0A4D9ELD0_9SAUR|nr:F-box and leucine-rich protein 22 [Platysternon megacephalum]
MRCLNFKSGMDTIVHGVKSEALGIIPFLNQKPLSSTQLDARGWIVIQPDAAMLGSQTSLPPWCVCINAPHIAGSSCCTGGGEDCGQYSLRKAGEWNFGSNSFPSTDNTLTSRAEPMWGWGSKLNRFHSCSTVLLSPLPIGAREGVVSLGLFRCKARFSMC